MLAALSLWAACIARPIRHEPAPRLIATDIGAGLPRSGQWRQGFVLADLDG